MPGWRSTLLTYCMDGDAGTSDGYREPLHWLTVNIFNISSFPFPIQVIYYVETSTMGS